MLENNASMLKIKRNVNKKAKQNQSSEQQTSRKFQIEKQRERESVCVSLRYQIWQQEQKLLTGVIYRQKEREREASLFFSFLFRVLVYYFKEEDVVGVALQITLINSACALKICNCDQSKGRLFNLQKRNVLILLCVVMETYRKRSKARTIERQTKKRITIFFFFLFSIFLTYLNDDIINK